MVPILPTHIREQVNAIFRLEQNCCSADIFNHSCSYTSSGKALKIISNEFGWTQQQSN